MSALGSKQAEVNDLFALFRDKAFVASEYAVDVFAWRVRHVLCAVLYFYREGVEWNVSSFYSRVFGVCQMIGGFSF
jgi:hypothetical protein